jgi:hypothetical protein
MGSTENCCSCVLKIEFLVLSTVINLGSDKVVLELRTKGKKQRKPKLAKKSASESHLC